MVLVKPQALRDFLSRVQQGIFHNYLFPFRIFEFVRIPPALCISIRTGLFIPATLYPYRRVLCNSSLNFPFSNPFRQLLAVSMGVEEEQDYSIKPENVTPTISASEWPLLLKNYDKRMCQCCWVRKFFDVGSQCS